MRLQGPLLHLHLAMHYTIFDNKLVIVKWPGNGEKSGKSLAGLDEMAKLAKAGGLPLGMKKSGMSFKGVVDISEVVVHCLFAFTSSLGQGIVMVHCDFQ